MTYYTVSGAGMCTAHFESVKWEDASDAVVEVRRR